MTTIKIVTDSTADIPKELAEQWDIAIVPLKVHLDDETYLDGVTLTPSEFFEKLGRASSFPSTSQPSPNDFVEKYQEILNEYGDETQIISIHLSSALSGTCQSARLGASLLEPAREIVVVDSKKASFLLGSIVIETAKAAKNGKTKDQCLDLIHKMMKEQKEFFVLDTLNYLQKGGRIGKAQAIVGTLLNVKPILSLNEAGEVYPFEKVRGKKKAISRILEECKKYAGEEQVIVSVLYGLNRPEAEELKDKLLQEFQIQEISLFEIGPVIGAHVGPDALAVVMYKP